MNNSNGMEIAIIGMACKFPGAKNISEYYNNLVAGKECLNTFTKDELLEAGITEDIINDKNYVKRSGIIENVEQFDNNLFNYTPRETELIDPQHRIFLQTAWESLEDAGYDSEKYTGNIGVFGGCSSNTYLLNNICKSSRIDDLNQYPVLLGNEKDFLCTRVSYKLNLKGPSITVQTGCSTSLVAVHLGCQSILNGDCDIVLAGGVTLRFPQISGYKYQEGGIPSPDGFCRPFDSNAGGTVVTNGVGVVVLKLLANAIHDNDHIYSVIKATSINNDGFDKVGFTAPSVNGQIEVMKDALKIADVDPSTISYIETHGTGTTLGDPIEFSALKHVYGGTTFNKNIAIGSVKANIGHTDVASGIAGLIKISLMLKNKVIFPQINFKEPNPQLGIKNSSIYIQQEFCKWQNGDDPRRAAVSSFGLGGTNAHAILEEPDFWQPSKNNKVQTKIEQQLIMISAETDKSLTSNKHKLLHFLETSCQCNLSDIAYTLSIGRKSMKKRFYAVVNNIDELKSALNTNPIEYVKGIETPKIIFIMEDYQNLNLNDIYLTYQKNDIFKSSFEECIKILETNYPNKHFQKLVLENEAYNSCNDELSKYVVTFIITYSLIRMLESFNVIVSNILGDNHSKNLLRCVYHKSAMEQVILELVNNPVPVNKKNAITDSIKKDEDQNMIILTLSGNNAVRKFSSEDIKTIQFDSEKSHQLLQNKSYLDIIGKLWTLGVPISMEKFYSKTFVSRVSLPTYCFDTEPYFITPNITNNKASNLISKKPGITDHVIYTDKSNNWDYNKIREKIKKIWKDVLGIKVINDDDDIYELCGDSFTALLMNAEIEKEFKIKLSNKTFIESNSLDKLAKNILTVLLNKESSLCEHIVKFRTAGDLAPIFLIHPAGGTVMGYKALVKHIPKDHPVYGIQYPSLDFAGKTFEMRELSEIYINSINKICPKKPVIIGGHSFGGNAAIEMALQLEAVGRKVEHLIMFDSHPPKAYYCNSVFSEDMFLKAFPIICGMFFGNKSVPRDMDTKTLDNAIEYLKMKNWIPWGFNNNEFKMYYELWRANHNTLRSHMPSGKIKCNFLFFRAHEFQPQEILDTLNINLYPEMDIKEWSLFSENPIQLFNVPGSHYNMLDEPNVSAIGTYLNKILAHVNELGIKN